MASREWMSMLEQERRIVEARLNEAPVPLGAIAIDLGLIVRRATLPPGISGEIRPDEDAQSGFVIRVNRHENRARQRFTLAHEISHFLLHRDQIGDGIVDDILYRSNLSDRREAQANRLGADLIMPWHLVNEKLKNYKQLDIEEQVERLSQDFEVSVTAMKIRLGISG